tara:strand:- start:179 stop:616 length:438 start_codon:yes stop_codon:yes gene_type:complete
MGFTIEGEQYFFSSINFYKKKKNWRNILEVAAENTSGKIENDAKRLAPKKTGRLANRINVDVEVEEDLVFIDVNCDHPAAGIIEYGGYSPFPPWGDASGLDFPVAKKIFENQPFKQPRPFLRPALQQNAVTLEKEIHKQAKELGP